MLDIFQVSSITYYFLRKLIIQCIRRYDTVIFKNHLWAETLHDRIRSIYKFRRIGKLWITHSSCLFDMAFKHTLLIVNPLEPQPLDLG